MNKCLVKKLKEEVTNNNLLPFGELKIVVNNASEAIVLFKIPSLGQGEYWYDVARITGNIVISNKNNESAKVTGTGYITIPNKYDINQIGMRDAISCDIDQLKYSPDVTYLAISDNGYINWDIADVATAFPVLRDFRAAASGIHGNIAVLIGHSETFTQLQLSRSAVGGNTSDLAKINFTSITLPNNLEGDLVDFVATRRAAPISEATGSVDFGGSSSRRLYFNGTKVNSFGATKNLSWTATTITWDGTTITA